MGMADIVYFSGDVEHFGNCNSAYNKMRFFVEYHVDILIGCRLRCRPVPEVSWSRVGGTLSSGRHISSSFGTKLTIQNVSASDADVYECRGHNNQGTARHHIRLIFGGGHCNCFAFICRVRPQICKNTSNLFPGQAQLHFLCYGIFGFAPLGLWGCTAT